MRRLGDDAGDAEQLHRRIKDLEAQLFQHQQLDERLRATLQELSVHQEELRTQNEELLEMQRTLENSRQKYAHLFDFAPIGYLGLSPQGIVREINLTGAEMFGYPRGRLLGKPFLLYVAETDHDALGRHLRRVFGGEEAVVELELLRRDAPSLPVELVSVPMRDDSGKPVGCRSTFSDITRRRQAEDQMRLGTTVLEHIPQGVMVTDAETRVLSVNRAFEHITGYRGREILGRTPRILQSGRQDRDFYERMWAGLTEKGCWEGEIWNRRKSGEIYPEWLDILTIRTPHGQVRNYIGIFSDITRQEEVRRRLHDLAYYDPLTGLPNRHLFQDRLRHALAQARRYGQRVGLMFIDLDRFKLLNDTLGHNYGDLLLKHVAERLKQCMRQVDTVSRMGGDEFTVLLPGVKETETSELVAQKLLAALNVPLDLDGHSYYIGASIGISHYPDDGEEPEILIKNADTAMYQAKGQGRNQFQVFEGTMSDGSSERLGLENDLRRALERREIEVHYQPQIDIKTGAPCGVEALMRWRHPQRGLVAPASFIPLAEEIGIIHELGDWILRQACVQIRTWHGQGMDKLRVAVNLSPHQFLLKDLPYRIGALLRETELDPAQLELEITESTTMPNLEHSIRTLEALRDMQVKIAMDDFGTGFSSLNYLQRLPIHALKIDRGFVAGIPDGDATLITRTIIQMARGLGLRVVAEGIETAEQLAFLQAQGCDEGQGYYFSKPVPAAECRLFLDQRVAPDSPGTA